MIADRRSLLRAGLGATAALASPAGPWTTPAQGGARDLPAIKGDVSCEADACAAVSEDFGRIMRAKPQMVVRPKSGADIAKVVQWAAARGLKVAPRGQGHSVYGRSLAEGGVVIDMTTIGAVGTSGPDQTPFSATGETGPSMKPAEVPATDRIVTGAGATWADILDAALARGLTPPVL